jgi:putative DNA primase/helicase
MVCASPIGATDDLLCAARAYVATGLAVIPVRADGSKAPRFTCWREFSDRRPTDTELVDWFASGSVGIGVTGGPASGNLVIFDFETWSAFNKWGRLLSGEDRKHLARCPMVRTPSGGAHVYCRLPEAVKGTKYAKDAAGKCLIETRGNGHFVVAPGSPPACHPTGRAYLLVRLGWIDGGPFEPIPLAVFHGLTLLAAELNEYVRPAAREVVGDRIAQVSAGDRPGDHFNARVSWGDILFSYGWTIYRSTASATYWCRPNKKPPGISASTGFCKGPNGRDLLYVFTSNGHPFEAECSYSRFAAYTLLNQGGDFSRATRALALAGYGAPLPKAVLKGVRP